MESSRPWPWPRGASRTTGHVLGLGLGLEGQVLGLGLGLGRRVLGLGLGLGKHVLGLDHFRLMCLVFTARCTIVQSAVLQLHVVRLSVCPSVCPSATLVDQDHIGGNFGN